MITGWVLLTWIDDTKTKFRKPVRLEIKAPDYPRLLENHDRVGITKVDRLFSFTTCKHSLAEGENRWIKGIPPEYAGSCESEYYKCNAELLKIAGVQIEDPPQEKKQTFAKIEHNFGPRIVLKPSFGVTLKEIKSKFKGS